MLLPFVPLFSCFLTFDIFPNILFKVFLKGLVALEILQCPVAYTEKVTIGFGPSVNIL